jgi:hypothetical protein
MKPADIQPPEDKALAATLARFLGVAAHGGLVLVHREPNVYRSSSPSEIVTARMSDGSKRRVFCKYAPQRTTGHGHRGGIRYEAAVYRELLARSPCPVPAFLGSHEDRASGTTWLFLEHLQGSDKLKHGDVPNLVTAARWLGNFHAFWEKRLDTAHFAIAYDRAYYRAWAQRTALHAREEVVRMPRVGTLINRFGDLAAELVASPRTLIHGEFTGSNVMYRGEDVYVVDWESTATGAGEIDLAALSDGWGNQTDAAVETAYRRSRWPGGAPRAFRRRLLLARAYWQLRWLGDDAQPPHEERSWRLGVLDRLATRLEMS